MSKKYKILINALCAGLVLYGLLLPFLTQLTSSIWIVSTAWVIPVGLVYWKFVEWYEEPDYQNMDKPNKVRAVILGMAGGWLSVSAIIHLFGFEFQSGLLRTLTGLVFSGILVWLIYDGLERGDKKKQRNK